MNGQMSRITYAPRRRRSPYRAMIEAEAPMVPEMYRLREAREAQRQQTALAERGLALTEEQIRNQERATRMSNIIGAGQVGTSAYMGYRMAHPAMHAGQAAGTGIAAGSIPASTTLGTGMAGGIPAAEGTMYGAGGAATTAGAGGAASMLIPLGIAYLGYRALAGSGLGHGRGVVSSMGRGIRSITRGVGRMAENLPLVGGLF